MKNVSFDILPSAARTTAETGSFTKNSNGKAIHVVLDITTSSGNPQVRLRIEALDKTSGKYYPLLTGNIEGGGPVTRVYRVGPGLDAVASAVANDFVPEDLRVIVEHFNSDSITYSVGGRLIG